jgi:ketosteroid isomerase-like protein
MLTNAHAIALAGDWLDAWNAHDLERILAHYAEDVEFTSPFAIRLTGAADGTVRGKAALREYFAAGLRAYPDLRFRMHHVCAGVGSFCVIYESVNALLAAEVFELNEAGEVVRVRAHYVPMSAGEQ